MIPLQTPPTPGKSTLPGRRKSYFWLALGLTVLGLLVLIGAPVTQDGSTYGRSPTGYRNWYETLQQQEQPVQRWQRSYTQLQGTGQTLIQIWGKRSPTPDPTDQVVIADWVREGNTVISLAWNGRVTAAPFSTQLPSPVGAIQIDTRRRHSLEPKKQETAELEDEWGAVLWAEPMGAGEWIHSTYPWLAANAYDPQSPNSQWLNILAARRGGPIWVDEWLHGHRDPVTSQTQAGVPRYQGVFDYLRQTPLAAIAAQILLLLLLLLWGKNIRFGPPLSLKAPEIANSEQYIQALAGVLNHAGHTDFVLQQLGQQLRQQLALLLGLTADNAQSQTLPEDPVLAEQWATQTGHSPQELLEVLHPTQANRALSDRELLTWLDKAAAILLVLHP